MMRETEHRQSCPWKLRTGDHLQDDLSDLSHRLFSIFGGPTMFYARFCFKITEDNRLGRPKQHQKSMGLLWCHRCLVGLPGFTHADLALLNTSAWWFQPPHLIPTGDWLGETICSNLCLEKVKQSFEKGTRAQTMFLAGDENMKSNTVMLSSILLQVNQIQSTLVQQNNITRTNMLEKKTKELWVFFGKKTHRRNLWIIKKAGSTPLTLW